MKSTLMKTALGMLALGLLATGAQAGWEQDGYDHRQANLQSRAYGQQINARQDRQMERIQSGMRSGQITRREFRELMQEQRTIHAMEQHFRADGRIDAREFRRLDRALDVAGRAIRIEKNDYQARHAYGSAPRFN
ncbi:MAG: hypothetical protein K0M48_07195 [Thiobacillus sp.]|nr:hypothetical protein [Thiobacillus sp.]